MRHQGAAGLSSSPRCLELLDAAVGDRDAHRVAEMAGLRGQAELQRSRYGRSVISRVISRVLGRVPGVRLRWVLAEVDAQAVADELGHREAEHRVRAEAGVVALEREEALSLLAPLPFGGHSDL